VLLLALLHHLLLPLAITLRLNGIPDILQLAGDIAILEYYGVSGDVLHIFLFLFLIGQ